MSAEFGEQYGEMQGQGQMRRGDGHGIGNPMAMEHQTMTEGMHIGGPHGTTPTAVEGMHGGPHGTTPTAMEGMHQQQQPQLRRSGSSSSSSSEDDGEGGRRKKGTKGKMMREKLGGEGQEGEQHHPASAEHITSTEGGEEAGQKKGMMEKIKEKIPGMH
nr:dehydrin 1 [Ipomoea batatas]